MTESDQANGETCSDARECHIGDLSETGAQTTFRLVYSGDTRPCDALVEAGQGALVLIHEGTFSKELHEEAIEKKHSTVEEAVDVGLRMGAAATILTHFSQRYPKMPPVQQQQQPQPQSHAIDGASIKKQLCADSAAHAMIAYPASDLMTLPLSTIPSLLPSLLPRLEVALEEDETTTGALAGGALADWAHTGLCTTTLTVRICHQLCATNRLFDYLSNDYMYQRSIIGWRNAIKLKSCVLSL